MKYVKIPFNWSLLKFLFENTNPKSNYFESEKNAKKKRNKALEQKLENESGE